MFKDWKFCQITEAKETEFQTLKCKTFCRYTRYGLSCRPVTNSAEFLTAVRSFTTDLTTLWQKRSTIDVITPEELDFCYSKNETPLFRMTAKFSTSLLGDRIESKTFLKSFKVFQYSLANEMSSEFTIHFT